MMFSAMSLQRVASDPVLKSWLDRPLGRQISMRPVSGEHFWQEDNQRKPQNCTYLSGFSLLPSIPPTETSINNSSFLGPRSMVYSVAQISSYANPCDAADVPSAQLERHWQKWASEGRRMESRDIALERMRECLSTRSSTLDLSDLMLESLPGRLPSQVTNLNVSGNRLTRLPEQLPSGLKTLDVSDNAGLRLARVPEGLTKFTAENIGLDTLPALPDSLEVCNVWRNELRYLPALPPSLRILEAGDNRLRELPELPFSLEFCDVPRNKLKKLPHLPPALIELIVKDNRVTKLPTLPDRLEKLDVSLNDLRKLPVLPESLQKLIAYGNFIETLSSIPASLIELDISDNALTRLPRDVIERFQHIQSVAFDGNYWRPAVAQALERFMSRASGAFLPTINASHEGRADARPLLQAVLDWYPAGGDHRVRDAWAGLSDDDREVQAFSAFLDRLGQVKFAQQTPAFRNAVADWLTSLAGNRALRSEAIEVAYDATQTCEDRVALTWNQLQKLSLHHAVSQATADTPKDKLLQSVKEVCALNLLEEIAANKVEERVLEFKKKFPDFSDDEVRGLVDEVEVHLAYPTGLAKKLNLLTPVRDMKFGDASHVKPADLKSALEHVSRFLDSSKFHFWMNNWQPWQSFLERMYPEKYADAHEKRSDFYADFDLYPKALAEVKLIENVKTDHEAEMILAPYLTDKYLAPLTRMALEVGVKEPAAREESRFLQTRL